MMDLNVYATGQSSSNRRVVAKYPDRLRCLHPHFGVGGGGGKSAAVSLDDDHERDDCDWARGVFGHEST